MARRSTTARRIVIFSSSFGGVTKAVSDAISRYFRTARIPAEVEVVDFLETFAPKSNLLARVAYQRPEQFFPSGVGSLRDVSVRWGELPVVREMEEGGAALLAAFLAEHRPDAVVTAFPLAAGFTCETGRAGMPVALVLTDFGIQRAWLHPRTSLYFVPNRDVLEELVVGGVPYDRICSAGIPVHERLLAPGDKSRRRKEFGLPDRFTALVSTQGAGPELVTVVKQLAKAGVRCITPADRDSRLTRQLEPIARESESLRIIDGCALNELFSVSDVVLTGAGGAGLIEAMTAGMPAVIYTPVPGQELHNVDFLINAGGTLLARDEGDLVEKVRYLSSHPDRLAQLVQAASTLLRRDAAQTVCERVFAAL